MVSSDKYRHIAALVVISDHLAVGEISSVMGVEPDRSRVRGSVRQDSPLRIPAKEHSWELCEFGGPEAALVDLIDQLTRRVLPLRSRLLDVRGRGCTIKLELVQRLAVADPAGPGFSIDAELVDLLAAVGAFVDVDQYIE